MRILLLIMLIATLGVVVNAQTKPTSVAPDAYILDADYEYVWGTSSDTLTYADTLSFVYRIKGSVTQDIGLDLYVDFVSGSAGGSLVTYRSPDGVNYVSTTDTIKVTSLEADALNSTRINLADYNSPYLKLYYLQTGTAVTIPRVYVYTKRN